MEGEYWGSEGSHEMFFNKPSLRRQRVRARRRPECNTAEQAQITTDEARDIEMLAERMASVVRNARGRAAVTRVGS